MTNVKAKPQEPNTRVYEPVWNLLKKPPYKVQLKVNPSLVRRVKKAVSKEKYHDLAFKELSGHGDEDHFYLKFTYYLNNQVLEIELANKFGVDMPQEDA